MADGKRERRIREAVALVRSHADDGREQGGALRDAFSKCQTLSEVLALSTALARSADRDEAEEVEIILRCAQPAREDIEEAATTMAALGYRKLTPVLRRLAKTGSPDAEKGE